MAKEIIDLTEVQCEATSKEEEETSNGLATVTSMLTSIGMAQYIDAFKKGEVDMEVLPHLSYRDLKELGVEWQQERQYILEKIAELVSEQTNGMYETSKRRKFNISRQTEHIRTTKVAMNGCKIRSGDKLKQLKLSEMVNANQSECRKTGTVRRTLPKRASPVLKEWQSIPGTDFVVDRFRGIVGLKNCHWFLTHFHSDHYMGLTKSFGKGNIYCSPVTAKLVQAKLGVSPERLHCIPIDQTVSIAGAKVTFVDANHCPGSVMIAVEDLNGPSVLHTGDARLTESMQDDATIRRLKEKGCVLVLDTTYCDPKHSFPPQADVIRYVSDTVVSELFHLKTLFLFGTYGIGKERLFLEVAKRAKRKIYIGIDKRAALDCMDLSSEERELLTTDHEATNLHAVALWRVKEEAMRKLLNGYGSRYTNVIGFRPTGWSYEKGMEKTHCGRRNKIGKITIYQVPYSEHSSFTEMRDFVQWLNPVRVVPSVGNDEGAKLQKMLSWLKQKPLS